MAALLPSNFGGSFPSCLVVFFFPNPSEKYAQSSTWASSSPRKNPRIFETTDYDDNDVVGVVFLVFLLRNQWQPNKVGAKTPLINGVK